MTFSLWLEVPKILRVKKVHKFSCGSTYDGEWVGDKMDGYGTYNWTDGSKYVGECKNGRRNGWGTHF